MDPSEEGPCRKIAQPTFEGILAAPISYQYRLESAKDSSERSLRKGGERE